MNIKLVLNPRKCVNSGILRIMLLLTSKNKSSVLALLASLLPFGVSNHHSPTSYQAQLLKHKFAPDVCTRTWSFQRTNGSIGNHFNHDAPQSSRHWLTEWPSDGARTGLLEFPSLPRWSPPQNAELLWIPTRTGPESAATFQLAGQSALNAVNQLLVVCFVVGGRQCCQIWWNCCFPFFT